MTLFQYTMDPGILDQSLVQRQLGRQQQLLYKENSSMIYCTLSVKSKYLQCYKHKKICVVRMSLCTKSHGGNSMQLELTFKEIHRLQLCHQHGKEHA